MTRKIDTKRAMPRLGASILNVFRAAWITLPALIGRTVTGALHFAEAWLTSSKKASYGIAVTRMLLACAALGILFSNFSTRFYTWGSGGAWSGDLADPASDFPHIWLFSIANRLATSDLAFTALYVVIGLLAVLVVVGYRMKLVLPVFLVLWIGLIEMQDMVGDQGDNMLRIAFILMLFADTSKRWSIDAIRRRKAEQRRTGPAISFLVEGKPIVTEWLTNASHNLAIIALAFQVIFVYTSGALYKAEGESWQGGYAIYAPLHVARFSPWPEFADFLTTWGPAVATLTVGSLILQVTFAGALLNKWTRRIALIGMIGFHVGIGILMGLPWFSLSMIAIDAIFVRDVTWSRMARWVRKSAGAVEEDAAPGPRRRSTALPGVPPRELDHAVAVGDDIRGDLETTPIPGSIRSRVRNVPVEQ